MKYIVNPGHAVSLKRGIVGSPKDPKNPTPQEIITEKDFKNGSRGLNMLAAHKNKIISPLADEKEIEEKEVIEPPGENTKSQPPKDKKNKITTGAEKK